MAANFDVIIPGLMQLPVTEIGEAFLQKRLPALNQILRYSYRSPSRMFDFEFMLANSLGMPASNLPFVSAFDDECLPSQSLLCEAVHLKPDMRNAYIVSLENSDKTDKHIATVINDIADYFKEDLSLSNINGRLWLMQLTKFQAPNHLPHVLSVIGRKADPYIKQSSGILEWYQLINEIQMYMHSHQVNQKRLQQGMATINSLWCWGGGELTAASNPEVKVFCDDFLTSAFLARIGLVPENLQGITDGIFAQNNICIDLSLLRALKAAQSDDLQAVIESIESTIFEPLLNAVGSGRLKIRLRTGHDFDYLLNRFSLLKFWQKPVNLATVIE